MTKTYRGLFSSHATTGMPTNGQNAPSKIRLLDDGRNLVLDYGNAGKYELSAEFLRVESPSAEVRGHGGQGGELPIEKENVRITGIDRCGHYAIQVIFDDGHDSGIYTWAYLWQLVREKEQRWTAYLRKLTQLGKSRSTQVQVVRLIDPSKD